MSSQRRIAVAFAIFLAGVLLPPVGSAQSTDKVFQVDVVATQPAKITKDLGSVTLYFNVTVKTDQANNPLTSQFTHDITLSMTTTSQDGWKVTGPSEARFTLATGATKTVTVKADVTMHNPPEDSVTVTIKAVSKPGYNGQTNPITEPIVAGMSQSSEDDDSAKAQRELKGSEALVSFAKTNQWVLLGLGCGVFVLAVLFAKRKKGGLGVASPQPVLEVLPGRGASFPIQLTNDAKRRQKVNLATSEVPPGWAAILPVESIELNAGEATTLWVTVKAPASAHHGESVKLSFVATGDDAADAAEQLLEANVVDRYGAAPPGEQSPPPEPLVAEKRPARRN